jgi:hypothetical protein
MRYVITTSEGGSPSYFETREAARASLRALDDQAPGSADDFLLWTYNDNGQRRGTPEWADELLSASPAPAMTPAFARGTGERRTPRRKLVGVAAGISLVCPTPVMAAASERAASSASESHQHVVAKRTPGRAGGRGEPD